MKYYKLKFKMKDKWDWIPFGIYKDSKEPIIRARNLIKNAHATKVIVEEIEEMTIYEEEGV